MEVNFNEANALSMELDQLIANYNERFFTESTIGGKRHWHTKMSRCGWCTGDYGTKCATDGCHRLQTEWHEHIYVYLRTSFYKKQDEKTERKQLEVVQRQLGSRVFSVIAIYGDHKLSVKKSTRRQEGLGYALAQIADDTHPFKRLYVRDVRRITRNLDDGQLYFALAQEFGVEIETTKGLYALSYEGKTKFIHAVRQAEYDNLKRSEGNRYSHTRSLLAGEWRGLPWAGYTGFGKNVRPDPKWENTLDFLFRQADHVSLKFLASWVTGNRLWVLHFGSEKEKPTKRSIREVINDPKYVGWRTRNKDEPGHLFKGNWTTVLTWERFVELQYLYPSNEQKALLEQSDFWLADKLICADCGKLMKQTGVHFYDGTTGGILVAENAYVCPAPWGASITACMPRKIYGAPHLHEQIEGILALMAGKRNRSVNLVDEWRALEPQNRRSFLANKKVLAHNLKVKDGVLLPPSWALR